VADDIQLDPMVVERLGEARATELAAELAGAGLAAVDAEELAVLQRQAAGYRRMAALVEGDG
jgi:hypothetical protein